ncbi:hypothetical protein PTKIN_Ptkin16aG0018500 [Pterospermum kingtungense]
MGKPASRWLKSVLGKKNSRDQSGSRGKKRSGSVGHSGRDSSGVLCHNPTTIPPNISPEEAVRLRSYYNETEKEQNEDAIAVAAATAAAADPAVAASQAALAVIRLTSHGRGTMFGGGHERWAAVKIQTVFRGYLARKALRALKGLVKIQALVRGYLVRKKAAATLHSMQAPIRAQVYFSSNTIHLLPASNMARLSCFIAALLEKIDSVLLLPFIKEDKKSVSLLIGLKSALTSISSVITDAEEKQFRQDAVNNWLEDLEQALYDAEDVVDEILYDNTRIKPEAESLNPKSLARVFASGGSIQKIVEVIHAIAKEKESLCLRELEAQNEMAESCSLPVSTCWQDENVICGREKDRCYVVDFLLSGNANLDVIALVGEGGLGKTTLAQLAYNDVNVSNHFNIKAWVSGRFDIYRIPREILAAIGFSSFDGCELDELQGKLSANWAGKKVLLVLDDVWYVDPIQWEGLQSSLESSAWGSKIIVTTRSNEAADAMGCSTRYHPDLLTPEDCWSIVGNSALTGRDRIEIKTLKDIGRKIVEKCKGLPMFARAIGGLLRFKKTSQEWRHVVDQLEIMSRYQTGEPISNILLLSYYHLPAQLKRCFAYCSLFPKVYEFEKEQLVLLWMAEGFLQHSTGKSMERVASECFDGLLKRSFFIPVNSRFRMHHLIHDLAMSLSYELCFRLMHSRILRQSEIPKRTRHLSLLKLHYDSTYELSADNLSVILGTNRLRTFYLINSHGSCQLSPEVLNLLFATQKRLRVLSLTHFQHAELPESIGELQYLRYLDVSDSALKRLPESLCALYYLQTLILTNCYALHVLPQGIVELVNLRKLQIKGTGLKQMPEEMGRLANLQSLSNFIVGHGGSSIKELGTLPTLHGALSVSELQNVSSASDASAANLEAMQYLEELELEWSCNNEDPSAGQEEVLENLKPSEELKRLSIISYGGTVFPNWFGNHSSLKITSLYLGYCCNCESLPPLGQLSLLEHLTIEGFSGIKCIGHEFYGVDVPGRIPFQCLKTLKFKDMSHWENWIIFEMEGKKFPSLEELYIVNCPKFIGDMPKSLPALTKLEISECEKFAASLAQTSERCVMKLHGCDKVQKETQGKSMTPSESDGEASSRTQSSGYEEEAVVKYMEPPRKLKKPLKAAKRAAERHRRKLSREAAVKFSFESYGDMENRFYESDLLNKKPAGEIAVLSECDGEAASQFSASMPQISSNEIQLELCETNENLAEERAVQDDLQLSGKLEKPSIGSSYGGKEPEISECQQPAAVVPSISEQCDTVQTRSDDDQTVAPQVSLSLIHQDQDDNQKEPLSGEDGNRQFPSSSVDFSSMNIVQNQTVEPQVSSSIMHQQQDRNQQLPSSSSDFSSMGIAQNQAIAPQVSPSIMHQNPDDNQEKPLSGEDGNQQCPSSSSNFSRMDTAQLIQQATDLHSLRIERSASNMLPKGILERSSLQHLYIIDCVYLETFSLSPSLKTLYIHNCQSLKFPQPNKEKNQDVLLEDLCLGRCCDSLKIFPLSYFPKLKALCLWDCRNLEYLSVEKELNTEPTSLESLEIKDCPNFRSLLEEEFQAPNLTSLVFFNCGSLKSLQWMQSFKSLQSLYINKCPALESFPVEGLPSGLVILCISFCDKIAPRKEWKLVELQSLCHFEIEGGCLNLESFPEEELLPTNLNSLRISRLSNLTSLDGKGLQSLTSIQTLEINCCDKLDSLPEHGMPSSLSSLSITNCSLLNPKFQSRKGKEWFEIAHIPFIQLDEEWIAALHSVN